MTKPPEERTETAKALARERARRYNAKPETKAKQRAYYSRPEVQARYKARAKTPKYKATQAAWRASERGKKLQRSYGRKKIGFSPELETFLEAEQQGLCAVCRRELQHGKSNQSAHADHCHVTGEPRGLLCADCNIAEGRIKSTGLDPVSFGVNLAHYLGCPPAKKFQA